MKAIKHLNTFAIGLPILIGLFGLIHENYIGTALISTMLTGFIQVVLGLLLLYYNPKNKYLQVYIATVVIFFLLWYLNASLIYSEYLTFFLIPMPLLLALYLSIIIYKKETL